MNPFPPEIRGIRSAEALVRVASRRVPVLAMLATAVVGLSTLGAERPDGRLQRSTEFIHAGGRAGGSRPNGSLSRESARLDGAVALGRGAPEISRCLLQSVVVDSLPCRSAVLIEAETGVVIFEQNAEASTAPASLTKMALQLVAFEDLSTGRVSLSDSVETSANASTMGGSQVFLRHGEKQTLEALLEAVVIVSANDAAMAVAEHLAGSEKAFVERMNVLVTELGCTGTRFTNVHGLDLRRQEKSVTTARDMARIARALLQHPEALRMASIRRKPFRNGEFWLDSTNLLLRRYPALDGLKTGYTPRAGGCFVGTASRDGVRLVSVVMKARPGGARFELTRRLMDSGFDREPRWVEIAREGQSVDPLRRIHVDRAERSDTFAVAAGVVRAVMERSRVAQVRFRFRSLPELEAPIEAGESLGFLDCRIDGRTFASVPAEAAENLARLPVVSPARQAR